MTQQDNKLEWKKVLWQETPEADIRVSQGYFYDEGDFIRLVGDSKEVTIRKDRVISIQTSNKKEGLARKWKKTS